MTDLERFQERLAVLTLRAQRVAARLERHQTRLRFLARERDDLAHRRDRLAEELAARTLITKLARAHKRQSDIVDALRAQLNYIITPEALRARIRRLKEAGEL